MRSYIEDVSYEDLSGLALLQRYRPLLELLKHDTATFAHSVRVAEWLKRLGMKQGMHQVQQQELFDLGLLHDVGKLLIPSTILNKTASLSDGEWVQVKDHPLNGYRILQNGSYSTAIRMAILQHHENLDGSGYPAGVKGNMITHYARMLRIVDSYDAMTTIRTYKEVLSEEEALEELEHKAGVYFDQDLVGVFHEMVRGCS
ncbi:HD-GYP domain-containing protein [Priestia koreensis]|uniref:HD-GYP domain-containing protein n=1 Tax=Priestia koreensis TaxID=284581 RepID=UPI001F59F825|nr:HD domain-containing phosphohydrolase [Priestia koreensis]UNL87459.1 HD domain-containing protein [Priestia koreensis]